MSLPYSLLQKTPFSAAKELEIPQSLWNALINFDTVYERPSSNYPPFNLIQKGEDDYIIEIAVAGFTPADIDVQLAGQNLSISSTVAEKPGETELKYLRKKLAKRSFKLEFTLGTHIQVRDATINNGILTIELVRVIPEEMKPRKIPILMQSQESEIKQVGETV